MPVAVVLAALLLVIPLGSAGGVLAGPTRTVTGEVLKIEGDAYIVRLASGDQIRLYVDRETDIDGVISMGNRIEAQVEPNGRAVALREVPAAQSPGAPADRR